MNTENIKVNRKVRETIRSRKIKNTFKYAPGNWEKKKKKAVDICAEINFNCVHSCFISQSGKLFIVFCVCL